MSRSRAALLLLSGAVAIAGLVYRFAPSGPPPLEVKVLDHSEAHGDSAAPAMCPWREPERDLHAFFPLAREYRQETLVLSPLRLEIQRRLGPGVPLESNSLYVYRVNDGRRLNGAFLIRRAAGEFGAIETVVAVGPARRIIGIRLQRHREPPPVAAFLESPAFLNAFRGKSAKSAFRLGDDLPAAPPVAKRSAESVAGAVRSLLIEYDAAMEARGHRLSGS